MTVNVTNLRSDTDSIFDDWGEALLIFRPTRTTGTGGRRTTTYAVVTQGGVNTIDGDVQPVFEKSESEERGIDILTIHNVFLPYDADVKIDDRIIWPTDGEVAGTGTGTSNTWTDATQSWSTDEWKGWWLIDNAIADFMVGSNTSTALTVSGTPTTGTYYLGKALIVNAVEQYECHKMVRCRIGE